MGSTTLHGEMPVGRGVGNKEKVDMSTQDTKCTVD